MTAAINKLYEAKGYAVCRAYLPPQRIHEGAVQIKLLEGRTGNVTVNGLRFTRQGLSDPPHPSGTGQGGQHGYPER